MSENKEASESAGDGFFRLAETDQRFDLHWKSGSLKYTNFKPMTEGGIAKLYSAFDENLRRTVVYKTLHDHLREDEIETQRFLREARVTANIAHPGTVPLYELGRDRDGNLFFTMKHVRGRDLQGIIGALDEGDANTQVAFPRSSLIDILIRACETVAHAHSRGVIHRDLKPANILTGQFGVTYVIDWGLAKIWGEPDLARPAMGHDEDPALTPVGRRYGTPFYMAPELARGDAHVDGRVDVFSLGLILFEILTHRQLLSGENVSEVVDQILNKPFPKPSEVAPDHDIPNEIEAICCKALEKEAKNRFQDVSEMAKALQEYRDVAQKLIERDAKEFSGGHWMNFVYNMSPVKLKLTLFMLVVILGFTVTRFGCGESRDNDLIEIAIRKQTGNREDALTNEDYGAVKTLGIDLNDEGIKDIELLGNLRNLEQLSLNDNEVSDLESVEKLKHLEELEIERNQIKNLKSLLGLKKLKKLNLIGNRIVDLTPIGELTQLEELYLDGNQVADISPLASLTKLKILGLSYNKVKDVTSLLGLRRLEKLHLGGNRIPAVNPLKKMTNLKSLDLRGNTPPFSYGEILEIKKALPNTGINSD